MCDLGLGAVAVALAHELVWRSDTSRWPGQRRGQHPAARLGLVCGATEAVRFLDASTIQLRAQRDGVRFDPDDRDVPTVSRFFGIVIAMFFDDHGYPHFHARHAAGEAKVRIDNLEVIDSALPRRQLRLVLAWAELHQEELIEKLAARSRG
jgi:hypothetical protein